MSEENSPKDSQVPGNPEQIKKTYTLIQSSFNWAVQELVDNPKTSIPIFLITLFFLFGSPYAIVNIPHLIWNDREIPVLYWGVFGVLNLIFVLIAGITIYKRIKEDKRQIDKIQRRESRAIKGLLSFNEKDEAIFDNLERGYIASKFSQKIAADTFRFGIITGKSGCGKSSLLRAGITPKLKNKEGFKVVYVKCTNEDLVKTIREAITSSIGVKITTEVHDLVSLFQQSAIDDEPVLFILDQFEQFFVHQRSPELRQAFALQLQNWYLNYKALNVKILLSVRNDFRFEVDAEFQDLLNYRWSVEENFILNKFTPEQSGKVFKAMADDAKIHCVEKEMEDVSRTDLADVEDGRVSPVDVQILAEMMDRSQNYENTSFDEKALLKVGGVEGLMEQFLLTNLDLISFDKKNPLRQAAVKILLFLTDLEQNARKGILSVDQILNETPTTLSAKDGLRIIASLEGNRLITPNEKDGKKGYELSHERLIPALRRITDDELTETGRVNQLLDRRTKEWINTNQKDVRYFFSWKELRRIKRQLSIIDWGINIEQKRQLILLSRRKLRKKILTVILPLSCLLSIIPTAIYLWNSNETVKIYKLEQELQKSLASTNSKNILNLITVSLHIAGKENFASEICRSDEFRDVNCFDLQLNTIKILRLRGQSQSAFYKLEELHQAIHSIKNDTSESKAKYLLSLAIEAEKFGGTSANSLLDEAYLILIPENERDESFSESIGELIFNPSLKLRCQIAIEFVRNKERAKGVNVLKRILTDLSMKISRETYIVRSRKIEDVNQLRLLFFLSPEIVNSFTKEELLESTNKEHIEDDESITIREREIVKAIVFSNSFDNQNGRAERIANELENQYYSSKENFDHPDFSTLAAIAKSFAICNQKEKSFHYFDKAMIFSKGKYSVISQEVNLLIALGNQLKDEEFLRKAESFLQSPSTPAINDMYFFEDQLLELYLSQFKVYKSLDQQQISHQIEALHLGFPPENKITFNGVKYPELPFFQRTKYFNTEAYLSKLGEYIYVLALNNMNIEAIGILDKTLESSYFSQNEESIIIILKWINKIPLATKNTYLIDNIYLKLYKQIDNLDSYLFYCKAVSYAEMGDLSQADYLFQKIDRNKIKALTSADILKAWQMRQDPNISKIEAQFENENSQKEFIKDTF